MMRRTNLILIVSFIIIPPLTGCSLFTKKKTADAGQSESVATYDLSRYEDTGGSYDPFAAQAESPEPAYQPAYQPVTSYATPVNSSASSSRDYFAGSDGVRHHTVMKSDTLYALARSYYNDASKWKTIYQANQDQISDPNRIRIGQRLVIP